MQLIINLKDNSKLRFLTELLKQLDFVDFKINKKEKKTTEQKHDFFQSAGLFEGRDIDAKKLRKKAWLRKK